MKLIFLKYRSALLNVIFVVFSIVTFVTCAIEDKPELVGCTSWQYKGALYDSRDSLDECIPGLVEFENVSFRITCSTGSCVQKVEVVTDGSNQAVIAP